MTNILSEYLGVHNIQLMDRINTILTEQFSDAPFSSSTLTQSALPLSQAYISGVKPRKQQAWHDLHRKLVHLYVHVFLPLHLSFKRSSKLQCMILLP